MTGGLGGGRAGDADDRDALRAAGRLVLPDTGRGAGVLVLCEVGTDALARESCARLARHGFVALAPWLPEAPGDDPSDAERVVVDAAAHGLLCEHATEGARLGALGFGRGGLLALDAAARGSRVGVVVSLEPAYHDPARPDHYDAVAARAAWDAALARLRAEL